MGLLLMATPSLAWKFAIGSTVAMWRATGREQRELDALDATVAANLPRPGQTEALISPVEHIRSGLLLKEAAAAAGRNKLSIIGYTPYLTDRENGLALHSAEISATGPYRELVRLVEHIERGMLGHGAPGRGTSAHDISVHGASVHGASVHGTIEYDKPEQGAGSGGIASGRIASGRIASVSYKLSWVGAARTPRLTAVILVQQLTKID